MKLFALPLSLFAPGPTPSSKRAAPGRVVKLHGVIIQSDATSFLGKVFIRPLEALDLWFAGLLGYQAANEPCLPIPLGMHAGIHAELEDGRRFVIEQLAGGMRDLFVGGLHWTPLEEFQHREGKAVGGWDVTIPLHQLRDMDAAAEERAISHLNHVRGRPFIQEDCTGFVGRVFGQKRRIFADSPVLRSIGIDMRSGEPALPLLSRHAEMDPESEALLRVAVLRELPDPEAKSGSISLRQLHHRLMVAGVFGVAALFAAMLFSKLSSRGRSRF